MISSRDWTLFDLLIPQCLLCALLDVYARYTTEKLDPGSEKWILDNEKYGPKLFEDVRISWAVNVPGRLHDKAQTDPYLFPYSLTFVRKAFVDTRKLANGKKLSLMQALDIDVPERFDQDSDTPVPTRHITAARRADSCAAAHRRSEPMAATEAKAGHTAGPWEFDEPGNWHGLASRVFHRSGDKFEPIAQVQFSGWPKRIGRANARLITAAPELYEACLALIRDIDSEPNSQHGFPSYAKAVAAIAKAGGAA